VSFDRWQRAGVYLLLSLAFLSSFFLHPTACPFGLHDWAFPCFDAQRPHIFGYYLAPWFERNLGQIDPLPHANPTQALLYAVASVSPMIALRGFLLIAVFLSAVGADVAAGSLCHVDSRPARFAAGIAYMASPFLATKLVSGHLFFLLDSAMLPFALVAFARIADGGLRWWAICGLCAGALLVKPQFAAMYLLLLPFLGASKGRILPWLSLWLLAGLIESPLIFTSISAYRSGELNNELQLHAWFANESVPWQHALDATAYFTKYYSALAGSATVATWQWVSALSFVVAIAAGGMLRRLALAAIAFGLLASGANGPLGLPLECLMVKFPPTSLFRELYDWLGLAPLVMACGIAVTLDLALRNIRHMVVRRSFVLSFVVVMGVLTWPVIGGRAARSVPLADIAPWLSEVKLVERVPESARVLWLPAIVPIGPAGTPGGADPFESQIGIHPSAQSYHPSGIYAYAAALGTDAGRLPPNLARRLGIGIVITRPGILDDALSVAAHAIGGPRATPARIPQLIPGAGPLALARGVPACEPGLRSEMDDDLAYVRCTAAEPAYIPRENPLTSTDDPRKGWVDAERWVELSYQLANPRWPVLFTLSREPHRFSLARRGVMLVYAPRGVRIDGEPLRGAWRWQRVMLTEGSHTAQPVGGLCAISAVMPEANNSSMAIAAIETELDAQLSDRIRGRYRAWLPPHPKSLLVLREGWSPYWRAYINGALIGSPLIADGYASGWLNSPSSHPSLLEIRNSLFPTYIALCSMSLIVWIALIALAAGVKPGRR
jgi:hypothetical protein